MSRWLILALALLLTPARAAEPPRIVVSVAPLHSLVAGVSGEAAAPYLLLRGGASPHTVALLPSDARALARADLVVGADPRLETFLERPLASLAADAEVLWLTGLDGVHRVEARAGGAWEDEAEHDDTADEAGHDHGDIDTHAWLDPRNAVVLTRRLAAWLAAADPGHASTYEANAARQVERLRALDAELARRLAPLGDVPYLVFHDAYHYLEARYGLHPVGALAVDPGRPPGARRLHAIHERIEHTGARCLFAEPQFEPKIVRVIQQATGIRSATLDPLGAALEPGPDLYERLMRNLARDLEECLRESES